MMIEKLKEHDVVDPKTDKVIGKIGCDLREIMDKLNEVIDATNRHEDIIRQIGEWASSKGECLWCETLTEVNLNDRMIGCTTLDIPESYKELHKVVESANVKLAGKYDIAVDALLRIKQQKMRLIENEERVGLLLDVFNIAEKAIEKIKEE